jgi:DNA polymerase-1
VVISTVDKDIAQMVNEHIVMENTMTNTVLDRAGVIEKFGIPPELIIDYLALLGDKSDNIPGVPGVGEKTALGLLQGIGGLDAIYTRLDEVASLEFRGAKTMAPKLEAHRELAYLSYQLATIKTDVKMDLAIGELHNGEANQPALLALFKELEFKTWIKELESDDTATAAQPKPDQNTPSDNGADPAPQPPPVEKDYQTVLTQQQLDNWVAKIKSASLVAVDTETTSLDYMQAQLVGVCVAVEPGEAAYIPFGHDYMGAPAQLSKEAVLAQLKPLLEDPEI